MSLKTCITVIVLSIVFVAGQDSQCPDNFFFYGSSCYFFSHDSESWVNALEQCKEMFTGDLVSIDSDAEGKYLLGVAVARNKTYWIGANDIITEGTWMWSNSAKQVSTDAWLPGEPNNVGGTENCAVMTQGGGWYDIPCQYPVPYICEKTPASA